MGIREQIKAYEKEVISELSTCGRSLIASNG